ncbi:MAG TPA: GAF and ANTAR domain-containing protein [Acidimicrobiales bacterium]|nr:GAF and ANTAR domain-containing protein [Acidimicrobiales bacterium]
MPERRTRELQLAETLAEVARALREERDVDATLDRIAELAAKTVDGCDAAGISIVEGNRITSRSITNDLPRMVDEIQSETQEGPCIDAIREHEVFVTGALSAESRWPDFARRAHEATGIESVASVRLFASEDTMGALNLYSLQPDAFDDQAVAVASVFAAHAAVALASARREEDLERKAASRDVIGMAKGIIMARQNVSDDEAFDVLCRASQRLNMKLRELAARIVHGEFAGESREGRAKGIGGGRRPEMRNDRP